MFADDVQSGQGRVKSQTRMSNVNFSYQYRHREPGGWLCHQRDQSTLRSYVCCD